tara:strand:+ start:542 stop:1144 length:603 start_codon:yes stop_codon:yes gene_type:complete
MKNKLILKKSFILENRDIHLSFNHYFKRSEISSNYKIVYLKDYAEFKRGQTITRKQVTSGNIPVVAGGKEPSCFHNKSNRDKNMITISSSGANAGYVNFYNSEIFAADCFTIKANEDYLLQNFLFHIIKSRQKEVYEMHSGSGQPHVYIKHFDNFKIPLPTLDEQYQILKKIDFIFEKIELNKKKNKLLLENVNTLIGGI